MKYNNEDKNLKARKAAVFMSNLLSSDKSDYEECKNDMIKLASLDEESAKNVASAIRSASIPLLAESEGIEDERVKEIAEGNIEDDFVDEPIEEDKLTEDEVIEDENEDEVIEDENEEDETKEVAQILIELPEELIPEIKSAIESVVGKPLDEEFEEAEEEVDEKDEPQENFEDENIEDEGLVEDFNNDEIEEEEEPVETLDKEEVTNMTAKELEARKANRDRILRMVESIDRKEDDVTPRDINLGKDTSYNGEPYKFDAKSQPVGEKKYPTMTLEGSEGNTLAADNEDMFDKVAVPLAGNTPPQLESSYDLFGFDGDEGTLGYEADFNEMLKIPSEGEKAGEDFVIPTQLNLPPQKTTVAARIVECMGCNNPEGSETHLVKCSDCGATLRLCEKCEESGYCPSCAATVTAKRAPQKPQGKDKKRKGVFEDGFKVNNKPEREAVEVPLGDAEVSGPVKMETESMDVKLGGSEGVDKEAKIYEARLKTAYSVSTRMALAGIISPDEVDGNVEMWMNDGLSVTSMKTQGALMIRSASNAAERLSSKIGGGSENRVGSYSVNPLFVSNPNKEPAVSELTDALRGMFTMPKIEEEE